MTGYAAPVADMALALEAVAGLSGYAPEAAEMAGPVLDEAARFAGEVLAPLDRVGDQEGARLENGVVRTPAGFADAYRRFVAGGWTTLPFPSEHGGQGLPWALAFAVQEMWQSACLAWGLGPILTQGAADLLEVWGSAEQKALYLPRLVSGEWTGAMVMTEPQAGSDLAAIRTRAVSDGDAYRLTGQKVFISYADHDMAENVVHLVLARSPDGPPGSRGISLYLVPRRLPGSEGRPGGRNDVTILGLEHKLGIHGSPTCTVAYGEDAGALGWQVGEENRGLPIMFTMMNNARLHVGLQGVAVAERAWQRARAFAETRVQGVGPGETEPGPISRHPDVRRMLATMRSLTEAGRALAYLAASELDRARRGDSDAQAAVDLLTPIVKGWCTEAAVEVASLGIQVHGGMGYVEETGAAQHLRDARVLPIYEGTNGIQAQDLLVRKVLRDEGAALGRLMARIGETAARLARTHDDALRGIGTRLARAHEVAAGTTEAMIALARSRPDDAAAGAAPYLMLLGTLAGGWTQARIAEALGGRGSDPADAERLASARFYARAILPRVHGLAGPALESGDAEGAATA